MNYKLLYLNHKKNIDKINTEVSKVLHSSLKKEQRHYIRYILQNNGKKLRALLSLLLLSSLKKNISQKDIILISSIEMVHSASLIHDDVIDNACTRRSQESVNSKWGNSHAVAIGTYVYATALKQIHKGEDLEVLGEFSKIVQRMCEGELFQLQEKKDKNISKQRYYRIIYCKTASLFSAATWLAGQLSQQNKRKKNLLKHLGIQIGFLYQLIDDVLDIIDNGNTLKKEKFQDIKNEQNTFPVFIYKKNAKNKIKNLSKLTENQIKYELNSYNVIEESMQLIKKQESKIINILKSLKVTKLEKEITTIIKFMVNRLISQV